MLKRINSRSGIYLLLRRLSILILALGLSWTTPVQAAPPAQDTITNMRFYLNVIYPPKFCAGQVYPIRVTPLADIDGEREDGQKFSYKEKIIPGVPVTVEITDQSILALDSNATNPKQSGALPGNLFETQPLKDQEKLGGLGEVVFMLKAKKVGITNLYLKAKVPRQWSDKKDKYFGPQGVPPGGPVKVINCDYKVTMKLDFKYSVSSGYSWLNGYLGTLITGKGKTAEETLTGEGTFDIAEGGFVPGCGFNYSGYRIPTKITGTLNDKDELQLSFDYQPASEASSGYCLGHGVDVHNEQFRTSVLIQEATFSAFGEAKQFPIKTPVTPIFITITVTPVNQGGGK